jgi:vanillate O-demethylase monooxygenase subunit
MSREAIFHQAEDRPSDEAIHGFRTGMAPFWHPVCEVGDLADGGLVPVRLLGRRLVIARLDGAVVALPDMCRHFQARLSLGEVVAVDGAQAVQCPYHGWAFGRGGRCVRIPQLAAGRPIPARADLPAFQTAERYGLVWVCLAENPAAPPPEFPEFDAPGFRIHRLREEQPMRTAATRMIMGTLDDTHFPWVHEGILGDRDRPEPPDHRVAREGFELVTRYEMEQPANRMTADVSRGGIVAPPKVRYAVHVHMPTAIRIAKETPDGRYVVWLACCPADWDETRNFWIFARNYDLSPESDRAFLEMSAHVREQDRPVIESQRPWLTPPFWSGVSMPIGPADLPLMEYQNWIQELQISTAV